ncbi:MAG: hypothetical protein KC649_02305 [Candidatus Omnitrophica bacterium]|nr:hypothetical protein [Candidatus Omnitrophota bacterium]
MRVLFFEIFESERNTIQKFLPSDLQAVFTAATFQSSELTPSSGDVICIRTQSDFPEDRMKDISAVLSRSTGYDHLRKLEDRPGMHLGYLPEYCSYAVAEHAVIMMMMLLRRIKKQTVQMTDFNREDLTGRQIPGKKVMICGVGNIGSEIYRLCSKLGMNCAGFDIDRRFEEVRYVSLSEGVQTSDVIICALPLTDRTEGLLDYKQLASGKSDKILVNISRGEITPAADLERLLTERKLSGVGLDVFADESVFADSLRSHNPVLVSDHQTLLRLQNREDVLMTPHNAFNTSEALEQKSLLTVQSLIHYQKYGAFPCEVSASA